ncbi:hypothetical protein M3P05_18990 [Sansalvadorimonas sp. 2012CJ34-2]|uniref:Spermidine synthase n=1 Tax=Parendozoicomonas callyspongiae TaxID=2942213 RepID=A0ABT0PL88_9GAMM|nr:hypothetical protein [Sansalvadorimonas sp. 2012CJ34-2]MCL6272011.1 hypothetical protein [Sansalvadorimonas sp. 2012CJ34-2]
MDMLPRALALLLIFLPFSLQAGPAMCINGFRSLPLEGVTVEGQKTMKVMDEGTFRTLFYKNARGEETIGSRISLLQPEVPIQAEHRELLASFLLAPSHGHSLVVGMKNIGLIRFLRNFTPAQFIDVVDQDTAMITVASEYFGVRSDDRLTVRHDEKLDYLLSRPRGIYDVVYLDREAVLQDTSDVFRDPTILRGIRDRLNEQGTLLVMLGGRRSAQKDIDRIIDVFPHVFVWETPDASHIIVAALKHRQIVNPLVLRERAGKLDQKINAGFSFSMFVEPMLAGEYRVMEM